MTVVEPHRTGTARRLNWLRAGVLGANDGIVSTAGLVVGVAGATTARGTIMTAGIAGLVAGAVSGAVSARLGRARVAPAMVRLVLGGAAAMAVTFGIGTLVGAAGL